MYVSHIFATIIVVCFYYNVIVLTLGDISYDLTIYHLATLLVFLQTTYWGRARYSTCAITVANHSSELYPYPGE